MKKVVLLNDTTYDNHYGCDLVVRSIEHLVTKHNGTLVAKIPFYTNWEKSKSTQNKIKKCDAVIVNGEGSLHSGNMYWLATISKFCKQHNKKVYLVNSIYQNNPKYYQEYLALFDRISVRESYSHNELTKIGIHSTIVPDLSFYNHGQQSKAVQNKDLDNHKIYFSDSTIESASEDLSLLNSVGNILNIRYYKFFRFNLKTPAFESIRANLLMNLKNLLCMKKRKSLSLRNEDLFIQKIVSSDLIISGRFHLICLAIKHQKAFIPYKTNTFKIKALLQDVFGSINQPPPIDKNNIDDFLKNYVLNNQEKMAQYTTEANRKIEYFFEKIMADIGSKSI